MPEKNFIETLLQELNLSSYDIKAETQLALAMEEGLSLDEFMISCRERFRREYSKDIVSADLKEISGLQAILTIYLSRSGFFDLLPEGLFFQTPKSASKISAAADMASAYKLNKKKEESVRDFFMPFENELFIQRLEVEKEEMLLLEGLQSGILNEYFMKFWDIPPTIPKRFIAPLLLLLPYAHKIAGNLELTAHSLELLLNENVEIRTIFSNDLGRGAIKTPVMGEALLGQDLVCGDNFWDGDPMIEIEIGPLEHSSVANYLEGGSRKVLMDTFIRFFVPAGLNNHIVINVPTHERQGMALVKGAEPILGYSCVLG